MTINLALEPIGGLIGNKGVVVVKSPASFLAITVAEDLYENNNPSKKLRRWDDANPMGAF
uniref:Uncharacterized protein n=1 Tax=Setaria digitata TaxID=48799 RepID=A0A915Q4B5_9BILA